MALKKKILEEQGAYAPNGSLAKPPIDLVGQGAYAPNGSLATPPVAPPSVTNNGTKLITDYDVGDYKSPYAQQITDTSNKVLNYKPFEYNPETDPAYQAYQKMYTREGDRAMKNAIGESAALTGGRANSWMQAAGEQANEVYMDQLGDKIPALFQAAYGMYNDKRNSDRADLGMLTEMENSNYNKFADDRNYDRGVLTSDRDYNHSLSRDKVADSQWEKTFAQNKDQWTQEFSRLTKNDKTAADQWLQQFNHQEQQDIINNALQNRSISVSEANAALNKAELDYKKEQDKIKIAADKITKKDGDILGTAYENMMSSGSPEDWLKKNAHVLTDDELKAMVGYLPKNKNTNTLLEYLLNNNN